MYVLHSRPEPVRHIGRGLRLEATLLWRSRWVVAALFVVALLALAYGRSAGVGPLAPETRRGCRLCDEALDLLRALAVEPVQRDVDGDPELSRLYDFRVPVVLVDGRVVGEGRLSREGLARALGR